MSVSLSSTQSPADGAAETVRLRLAELLGPQRYAQYFQAGTEIRVRNGEAEVIVPTRFLADLLERRFGAIIVEALSAAPGVEPPPVRFTVRGQPGARLAHSEQGDPDSSPIGPIIPRPSSPPSRPADDRRHAQRARQAMNFRLDDFIVGSSNRLAYEAALRIAEGTGASGAMSRLFIHGVCGVGKTHLLQGVCARFKEAHPGSVVRYTTGETFTNEFVAAIKSGRCDSFRASYRAVDLLCVDDIHFLTNKQATQGELLHTFDAIDLGGARVVIASDEHPRLFKKFSDSLISRFVSGMVAKLEAPDRELREQIIRLLAQRRGLVLDEAAIGAIAQRAASGGYVRGDTGSPCSVREIEGLVTRVEAVWRLLPEVRGAGGDESRGIGWAAVSRALGSELEGERPPGSRTGRPSRPLKVEQISSVVCRDLGVQNSDLMGRGRHPRVVLARSVASFLCRRLTTLSFPEIARGLGRPNHSTIVTAVQRVESLIERNSPAETKGDLATVSLRELCDRLGERVLRESV
ncbi:MAG: ATP-binding protein [Phycisphaerales bacterium]|nr:ATP-binding protein [Phycisphaerales bacterium]